MKRVIVWLLIAALLLPCSALAIHPAFFASSGQSFYAPLTTTLVQTLGAGSPTFTRTTTAWVRDFEGLFKQVKSGEARFEGARRVENLVSTKSEDISNAAWTKTNGSADSAVRFRATSANATCLQSRTESGHTYRLRARIKRVTGSGNVQLTLDNTAFTTITLTSSYQVFSISGAVTNPNYGVRIVTSGDEIDITEIQLTQVTGQANQNPSEYISVGVLSAPFHGAGVDGVKYFTYQNGNTVDGSGIVTEAQGAAISESTLKGVFIEGQRTNTLLRSRSLDNNTVWIQNNSITVAKDAQGVDGVSNSAFTLTDPGGTYSYIEQAITVTNDGNTHTGSVYIKKDAVTSRFVEVQFNLSGGTSSPNRAIHVNTSTGQTTSRNFAGTSSFGADDAGSWWRVWIALTNNTQGNTTLKIALAPAGGTVFGTFSGAATGSAVFDAAQVELNVSFPSSPIPTTTVSVTRNADILSYPSSGNVDGTKGSASAVFIVPEIVSVAKHIIVTDSGNNGRPIYTLAGGAIRTYDGTNVVSGGNAIINTLMKVCSSWGGSTMKQSANGGAVVSGSFDGSIGGDIILIGSRASAQEPAYGTIKQVKIWKRALPDSRMIQETTP